MIIKVIGGLLILMGIADLIGSFTGFDLWGQGLGISLPEFIWSFTAYIELGLGFFLFNLNLGGQESEQTDS